jgi:Na+/melibiose symporter-like transporter
MQEHSAQRLPFHKKVIYALGQLGWSLCSFGVFNLLYYFYDSPVRPNSDIPIFPAFVATAAILGIAASFTRLFDSIADPLVAGWSDQSKSKFGRRRIFMAVGAFPFALLSVLVFFPPVKTPSTLNIVWVFICLTLFYFFMTTYVTPFFALLSELGKNSKERLQLSTMISITWALGFVGGNSVYAFQGLLEKMFFLKEGMTPALIMANSAKAFQTSIVIYAVVSLILMYLPVIFIDECKYCERHVSKEGSFEALKTAFKNRNFLTFTLSDLTYFLALTFVQSGISYYTIQLLGLDKSMATTFMAIMFVCSFVFYVPVSLLAAKIGKKKLLMIGFAWFGLCYIFISFWGNPRIAGDDLSFWPRFFFNPMLQGGIAMILVSIPMAIFGIIPNAIIADIAESDGIKNGNFKAGIFFGARTFMSKAGASLSLLIFPVITHLGFNSGGAVKTSGVRLTLIAAFCFLMLGLLIFSRYNEKEVDSLLAKKESN